MDLDALRFANFKLLDEAVEDWDLIVRSLKELAEDADKGLHQAATKANWAGENHKVTKAFIYKTSGEIQDAHAQAKSIHAILSDTAAELRSSQTRLKTAMDNGLKKNLTVMDTGNGTFTVTMNIHPDRAAEGYTPPSHNQNDVTALCKEVTDILTAATESDNSASKVLSALAKQTTYGFSDGTYKDRDAAAAALKEAEELAAIAKKKPTDLTTADIDRLNKSLAQYSDDPLFAERFTTSLGPKGLMDFWTGLHDSNQTGMLLYEREDKLDDLQRNLGMTLAEATQSQSADMASWKGRMVAMGDDFVGSGRQYMGYQVMGNLLRTGDYDDDFLKSYGTALMRTERERSGNGDQPELAWAHVGNGPWLNHLGEESGRDPLSGYLKALANSPDAATEFFHQEFVSKEDSPFEKEGENGKKSNVALSNFDYIFGERWPAESTDNKEIVGAKNNLGLTLEAAITGHPAGELPMATEAPPHTADQARLMEKLVTSIAEKPELLTNHQVMGDSIGQITSEYLPDINRAVANDPDGDVDKLFPVAGTAADLRHADVAALMVSVGQNPEGYAAIEVANKAYMANLMDYHLNPDTPPEYSKNLEQTITNIAHGSGQISGMLTVGQQEAIVGPAHQKAEDFKNSVDVWKGVTSGVIGTGIGVGTSFAATPAVGAVAGGAAGTISGAIVELFFQQFEPTDMEEAGPKSGAAWADGMEKNSAYTEKAAELAAQAHHRKDLQDAGIDETARTASQQGFRNGGTDVLFMAPHLKTEVEG
jgi:hypothetical protein